MPVKKIKNITSTDAPNNRFYALANAFEAGQEDMSWSEWKAKHPHIKEVKDSNLSKEYKEHYKKKYPIEETRI